jgi:two-component system, chemotaxis family, CheB/CheR fusion protein
VANIPAGASAPVLHEGGGGYRIAKPLRERVLFAGHNVLHDPPFSRIDLISCRNLFIYLRPEAQERVLETFHFALRPEGMLFLGASESVGDSGCSRSGRGTHRIYLRSTAPHRVPSASFVGRPTAWQGSVSDRDPVLTEFPPVSRRFSYGELHLRMLEAVRACERDRG